MQNTRIDITLQQTSHYDNYHNTNDLRTFSQIKATAVPLISLHLRPSRIKRPIYISRPKKEQDIRRNKQQRLGKENRRHEQKAPYSVTDHRHRQKASR